MSATLAPQAEKIKSSPINSMVHGPVLSLLIRLALPTVAVMFITTLLVSPRPILSARWACKRSRPYR